MTKPSVDIGRYGIWYGMIDTLPAPQARAAAQLVEDLGFSTLWIAEAVGRDPFVTAAVLLDATRSLNLATGIANIYARDPMTMRSAQQTLAEAYPGRFLLGMGVSHAHLVSHLRKHDYSRPYTHMVGYLDRMDESIYFAPPPATDPGRVLAALGPKMLRLAAERANGAHPYFATPDHTRTAREIMGDDAVLAPEQMVVLETDPSRAREIARAAMAVYLRAPNYCNNLRRLGFDDADLADGGSDRLVDAIVAWGGPEQVAARITEHHDAGADHVAVQVLRGDATLPEAEFRILASALFGS
jgi:probable F420-dependent oxidoreductase